MPVKLGSFSEMQLWWARSGSSHNFYLFRWVETGILGLVVGIYFIFIYFYFLSKIKVVKCCEKSAILIVVLRAIGIAMVIHSTLEAVGILTHGWILRDLPFSLCFIIVIYLFNSKEKITSCNAE
jgi:O-antigen ligase